MKVISNLNIKQGCPNGWKKGEQDECLLCVGQFPATFHQALKICANDFNAHLLTIHNELKQKFVEQWIKDDKINANIWLDAMRIDHSNANTSFIWREGRELDYENFNKVQLDNMGENEYCLHVYPDATWNDISCIKFYEYNPNFNVVCEKSCS